MNIFIFRRDLRIYDNTSLLEMIKEDGEHKLIFIYRKNQENNYFSHKSFKYLNSLLIQLSKKVNINFFESIEDISVLEEINKEQKIKSIYSNSDVTNFAINRDKKIKKWCLKNGIKFRSFNDYLLFDPKKMLNGSGKCFKTFSPFHKKCLQNIEMVSSRKKIIDTNLFTKIKKNLFTTNVKEGDSQNFKTKRKDVFEAIEKTIAAGFKEKRDFLDYKNSMISAPLKFGIISSREVVEFALKKSGMSFLRQFLWKEFFYHYFLHNRKEYKIRGERPTNINRNYDKWKFSYDPKWIEKWKKGETGIEIIDAAMNELISTGYMHNRARMIVATFFCKNMNQDWRIGEKYFAQKLVDYDPIINNQSWQWCSFTGLDFRGMYRVFSPKIQSEKFDPSKKYIKKFLPSKKIESFVDEKETRKMFLERMKNFKKKY